MAKNKKTIDSMVSYNEKMANAATPAKVKHLNVDSKTATNRANQGYHSMTDSRSSAGLYTQKDANGNKAAVATTKQGNMGVETVGADGKITVNSKNATTNLFTDKDNGHQSGRRKLTKKQEANGEKAWQGNRSQRLYEAKLSMLNDQRSDEALNAVYGEGNWKRAEGNTLRERAASIGMSIG